MLNQTKTKIKPADLILQARIESKIFLVRGRKVMLDRDLAALYDVTTGNLNKAVKRNIERFPDDFMFQLTKEETRNWIFQFGTSSKERMGIRRRLYAFTEQVVAMLSSVLRSRKAVQVNIQIMRVFVKVKEIILTNQQLRVKIEGLERKYDGQFMVIFKAIKCLLEIKKEPKRQIGFNRN